MQLLPGETILLEAEPSRSLASTWLFSKALPIALPIAFYAGLLVMVSWIFFNLPAERGKPAPYSFSVGVSVVVVGFLAVWAIAYIYCVQLGRSFEHKNH